MFEHLNPAEAARSVRTMLRPEPYFLITLRSYYLSTLTQGLHPVERPELEVPSKPGSTRRCAHGETADASS